MAKGTILVVEDSPTEMRLITALLRGKGYTILTAETGEEAIEMATKEAPKLVVLDIVLPKKNGYQVCRHLKTGASTKDIKIILLSSKNQETDKVWGIKQGADEYLEKPFKEEELLAAIVKYMN